MELGENFKKEGLEINLDILARGAKDAMADNTVLSAKERDDVLAKFQNDFKLRQASELKKLAEDNKKAGEQYRVSNKTKPGVIVLASGLQYKIIEQGAGKTPTANDSVTVDYEGKVISGEVFDSSYKRGKPVSFAVTDVIPGWKEALTLMKAGSTWEIVVPPNLAYGERGLGGPIGPNETLLFKIKLISVNTAPTTGAGQK